MVERSRRGLVICRAMHGSIPGTTSAPCARYTLGGTPTSSEKRVLKVPSEVPRRKVDRPRQGGDVGRSVVLEVHAVADAPQEHECLQVRSSGHLTIVARLLAGIRVLRMDETHGVEDVVVGVQGPAGEVGRDGREVRDHRDLHA